MLTADQRETVQKRLLEEREKLIEILREFDRTRDRSLQDETGELSMYRLHPADIGTEAMEREKQFLLASNEGRRLYDITEGLRRLYSEPERFGECESCGRDISMERLDVVPAATLCAECQRRAEGAS